MLKYQAVTKKVKDQAATEIMKDPGELQKKDMSE